MKAVNGPWVLQNANRCECDGSEGPVEHESEWNSDDEDVLNTEDRVENHPFKRFGILAFHPYKEIIFLHRRLDRGLIGLSLEYLKT